jgi:ABC-2 type transport system ATP-binding protein
MKIGSLDNFSGNGASLRSMLKVQDLVMKYGNRAAVRGLSFEVAPGSIVAFLGPNGAGKTTTIKALTTQAKPTGGTVELNGIDVTMYPNQARKYFGVVFQEASLDHRLTAYENLDFYGVLYKVPRKSRDARIEELLKVFALWDRKSDLVGKFSGGMRRRLEIARCLLHSPKIIFMDEPTLGLDPQTRRHLWSQIKILNERDAVTVFLTTHQMEEAEQIAHWIYIIDHGRVIAQGTAESIREQTASATLDDAFIALTGKTIRPDAIDGQSRQFAPTGRD